MTSKAQSGMDAKNGEEFAILSSRFKDKKERAKAQKGKGKKDDQIRVENQKKKEELEEVRYGKIDKIATASGVDDAKDSEEV